MSLLLMVSMVPISFLSCFPSSLKDSGRLWPGYEDISSKLERLLNSQPSTGCDSLRPSLLSSLSADDLIAVSISEECIVDAFSHLKHDGSTLVSDHLILYQPSAHH